MTCMHACRNLRNPHIISLLAYALNEEAIVLVTNYVDGHNFHKIIFDKDLVKEV